MEMICVTGAGGQVGSEVAKQLIANKVPVRLAFNSAHKAESAKSNGFEAVIIDYGKPETLEEAFKGCEKVFLLGPNAVDQAEFEVNAVSAAQKVGVKHVVKLSVLNTEDDSYEFGRVHRIAEKELEESEMNWTFLRASQFMQNLTTYMAHPIKGQDAFYTACGDGKLSHLDVRDIGRVAYHALTEDSHMNRAYVLTGPEALSYDEVALLLSNDLGRHIRHVRLTDEEFRQGMISGGTPVEFADRVVGLDQYFRNGGVEEVSTDIEKVTGRKANSIDNFIKEFSRTNVWK